MMMVKWKGSDWEYVMGRRCQEVVKWRGSDWEYVMGRSGNDRNSGMGVKKL